MEIQNQKNLRNMITNNKAIIGLILGIFGLILLLVSSTLGLLIISKGYFIMGIIVFISPIVMLIFGLIMGIYGLKTTKRIVAIISIVICSLGLIWFSFLVLSFVFFASNAGTDDTSSINLLPMYGGENVVKTDEQLQSDKEFIDSVVKEIGSREEASVGISNGAQKWFEQGDLDTAMKRFNQAWLLDPNNPEPYNGFAEILKQRGDTTEAEKMLKLAQEKELLKNTAIVDSNITSTKKEAIIKAYLDFEKIFNMKDQAKFIEYFKKSQPETADELQKLFIKDKNNFKKTLSFFNSSFTAESFRLPSTVWNQKENGLEEVVFKDVQNTEVSYYFINVKNVWYLSLNYPKESKLVITDKLLYDTNMENLLMNGISDDNFTSILDELLHRYQKNNDLKALNRFYDIASVADGGYADLYSEKIYNFFEENPKSFIETTYKRKDRENLYGMVMFDEDTSPEFLSSLEKVKSYGHISDGFLYVYNHISY